MSKGGISVKVYIAGKITGDRNYRKKFSCAQEDLEGQGFTVLNPAKLPEGLLPEDYMRICMAMLDSADIVAFLPDYEQSRGAQIEWAWCQYVSKKTMYLESMSFYRAYPKEDDHQTAHIDREAWTAEWEEDGECEHKLYRIKDPAKWKKYKCSKCGYKAGRRSGQKFCPNCGRAMTSEALVELEKRVRGE